MKSFSAAGCSIFVALFGLPFAAVGLFTTGVIFYTLANWVDVLEWQETPATILTVEVQGGGDSDSMQTDATYSYTWNGEQFTGDRVNLHPGSDNIGSFQFRIAEELTAHQKSGEPFRCFVDPSDAASSILYRDLRWEMLSVLSIFGTAFGTVGCGLVFATLMSIPASRRQAALQLEYPDEPWRWKPQWSDGVIRNDGTSWWLIPLAIYWVIVTLPGGIGALSAIAGGSLLSIFGLIMPGLACLIARAAIRAHIRRRVYGESRVQLDRFPAITGGVMSGTLLIEHDADPLAVWNLKLECERTTGTGEDRETDTICELNESVEGTERSDDWGRSAVPFQFSIPYSAPQTDSEGSVEVDWKLSIDSERTETEFRAEFEIPVFKTDESSPDIRDAAGELAAEQSIRDERLDDLQPDGPLMEARLKVAEQPDGTVTVVAEAGRHFKAGLFMGLFAVIWDGVCVALWNVDGVPCAFPILFSLFGALITWAAFDIAFRSSRLEIGRESLTFCNGWFGRGKEHTIPLSEIQDVNIESKMSIGSTQYPDVIITLHSDRKHTVMSHIRGRTAAERVMERILEAVTR